MAEPVNWQSGKNGGEILTEKISSFQLSILVANFLFTGVIISLPQVLAESSNQVSWLSPLVVLGVISGFLWLVVGKTKQLQRLSKTFLLGKPTKLERVFLVCFGILFITAAIRDLRALIDFVATVLLPTTPIDVMSILAGFIVIYMAAAGLEVIARVTVIQFITLAAVIIALPFMLMNGMELGNFQPIMDVDLLPGLAKSSFLLLSWAGEAIFILILIQNLDDVAGAKKATVRGIVVAMCLFALVVAVEVAVLGVDIVSVSSYPSLQMIQQINLTDFLDRLDLVIVTIWIPCFIAKIALDVYLVNRCLTSGKKQPNNIIIIPLGIALAHLSVLLFRNNTEHIEFSFYTWAVWGLALELLIGIIFIIRRKIS
ncbi:spore germination protein [Mesobacillus persicus]|uniref:Spore germination protein n=1 Tax=Mesobacillus persicus TaxID=930146 RepID=A0A1H8EQI6_9BACI|nr:endospore germination permease [Mesobacillus persicus]SEN21646.1 spore germination protein [Mesobacillus persicus]